MQIKITTTLDISEENKGLLPIVLADIGYNEWKENKIKDAKKEAHDAYILTIDINVPFEEPEFDETTVNTSTDTFIKEYLSNNSKNSLKELIAASVNKYFGGVMKNNAQAVNSALETAIASIVTITE